MALEYIKSFIYGILFGIPFCLAAGPVFFLLIQAGVNKGVKYALAISYGVVLADFLLINVTYFFVGTIQNFIIQNYTAIQFSIALILFAMGIFSIFRKVGNTDNASKISNKNIVLFFMNGFVLNAFNPSNVLVWIGVNSKLIMYDKIYHFFFYLAAILTITILMVSISFLSNKIQPYLTLKIIKKINVALGLIYILFSISLVIGGGYFENLL